MTHTPYSFCGELKHRLLLIATALLLFPQWAAAQSGPAPVTSINHTGMGTFSGTATSSNVEHVWFVFNANMGDLLTITTNTAFTSDVYLYRDHDNCVLPGGRPQVCMTQVRKFPEGTFTYGVPATGQYAMQLDWVGANAAGNYTVSISGSSATTSLCPQPAAPLLTGCTDTILANPGSCGQWVNFGLSATNASLLMWKTDALLPPTIQGFQNFGDASGFDTTAAFVMPGFTKVTFKAFSGCGSAPATCEFIVNDINHIPPTVSPLSFQFYNSPIGTCGVPSTVATPPLVNDHCLNGFFPTALTSNAPAMLLPGTHNITWTATSITGRAGTATQQITVYDLQKPTFTSLPANITVDNVAGTCGATVSWASPTATDNCGVRDIFSSPASGSVFSVGTTTITNYAYALNFQPSDAAYFTVTVNDTAKPAIVGLPANITVDNDAGICGAAVSWTEPSTTDNCTGATIAPSVPNGTVFPPGTTTVFYTATDAHGNTTSASFTVTVNDTEKPTIVGLPANITVGNDAGVCGAIVSWPEPTAADCTGATIAPSALNGTVFPLGTTTVSYAAADAHGNTTSASFTVTVNDTENPTIVGLPANITVGNDLSTCGATVSWIEPTATDNCSGATIAPSALNGTEFPVGITVVSYTAGDAHGNTNTASFTVTVNDTQKPAIVGMPSNITVGTDPLACNATVTWTEPTTTDNCPGATIPASLMNGALFVTGTSTVSYTATDAHGNTTTESFTVTVNDNEKPTITPPADIIINDVCSAVPVTLGDATTFDNCGVQGVTNDAPALFPVGTTVVTYTVTDVNGNTNTATQTVTINPAVMVGSISVTPSTTIYQNYGQQSVSLNVMPVGGTKPYYFSWSNSATSNTITVAPSATTTYTVTVTDAVGCSQTLSETITVVPTACGNNNDKMLVCHNGNTLCVSANAVAAHLGHGDYLGACNTSNKGGGQQEEAEQGVMQEMTASNIEIYPNPTTGVLYVRLPEMGATSVTVMDITGKTIAQQQVKGGVQQMLQFDLSGQAKGVYMIKLVSAEKTFQSRVVLQ